MTYGTLDGTLPPPDPTPKPKPDHFGGPLGGAPTDQQVGPVGQPQVGEPPSVPKTGAGNGKTTVDTPSLKIFADNMKTLTDRAKTSLEQLRPVNVKAGAFGQAYEMSTKANTQRNDFEQVLEKLVEGLTDLSDKMGKLATDYDTTEEMNSIKAKDLTDAMAETQSDFTALLSAHGDPVTGLK